MQRVSLLGRGPELWLSSSYLSWDSALSYSSNRTTRKKTQQQHFINPPLRNFFTMEKSQAIWLGAERTICFKHSRMVREIWLQHCIVIENMTVTEGVMCSNVNCNQNASVKNNNNVLTYLAKSKFLFLYRTRTNVHTCQISFNSFWDKDNVFFCSGLLLLPTTVIFSCM